MSRSTYSVSQRWLRWQSLILAIVLLSVIVISRVNAETALLAPTAVSFSKIFTPDTIGPGSTTTLSFSIVNPDPVNLTNLTFTDTLPAGVFIATPANATATCDSVFVAPDGGTTISFSADRLGQYSACDITVDVTSVVTGTHVNISEQLTSDAGEHGNATANLTVDQGLPGFSKSFSPSTIPPGGTSTLTFLVDNTANQADVLSLNFTDILPEGMVVAALPNAFTDCDSGEPALPPTLNAVPGTNVINLIANGNSDFPVLPAMSSCVVTVDVTVTDPGEYVNISGPLAGQSGTGSWTSGKAVAVLEAPRKFLVKSFTDDPVAPGDTVTLEFTVTNLDRSEGVTNVTFSDDLEDTLSGLAADGLPLADPCGAGSQLTGTSTITLTGGNLPAEGSCTFSVTLQVPTAASAGIYTNTTSSVSAWILGDTAVYDPATDRLVVSAAPRLVKTFDDPVAAGGTVTLTFTITNTSPISPATSIAFDDELTKIFPSPLSVGLPSNGFCGAGSSMSLISPGTDRQAISMIGGELGVGGSCTFSVTIDVPTDMAGGTYYNVTDNIFALVNGVPVEGGAAVDDLLIVAAPDLRKSFDDPVIPGDTVTLEFTLSHAATAPGDATNIAFSDDLTFLSDLAAIGLPAADVCGAGSLISGTTNLDFSGGSLVPGESCVFSVTLQVPVSSTSGIFNNQTSNVTADVLGLGTTGNPAQDELTVAGVSITKTFIGDPVIPGDTVILEFSIVNASTVHTATSILFQDDLSAILSGLAATDLPKTDVCGSGSSLSGPSSLTFSGGSLDTETSCTFTVTLQVPPGTASGTYNNVTTGFQATIAGATAVLENAADELTVSSDWLLFDKSFIGDPVIPGDPVTLAFTITNLHATQSVADVAFTDDLNAVLSGLAATGLPANDVCGTGSQINGTSTLALTGGDLGPGGSCTFSVDLLVPDGAAFGTYPNTTTDATGTIGGLGVRGDPAMDALLVSGLEFSKSFDGPTVAGGNLVLTFVIQNPSTDTVANDISFSDDLDAVIPGLVAIDLPENNICGLGSQFEGASFLNLRGGSLPPVGSCSFDVTLQVPITASAGSFVNTTSDLLLGGGKASSAATATLTVEPPPDFSKSFAPETILLGDISMLSFTIDNTASSLATSDLDFTDNLPAGMLVAAPPNASTTCTGGTLTAMAGTGSITYSGGTVGAGASCVVQVDVTGIAVGTHLNTTDDLTSSSGNSGPASDTLSVDPVADLAIAKSDLADPVVAGGTMTYTLVATNNGPSEATSIVVTDTLPNEFTPSGNTCGASGDPLVWNIGSLPINDTDTCTIYGAVDAGFSGLITNTATVASDVFDPQPANDRVTETTTVYEPASAGDYVWHDVNQDGIQDGGEMGVPDVIVNLRDGATAVQLATTTTDASGFYSFTNLVPGDYLIEFVLPSGFVFTIQDQGTDNADSDADPDTGRTPVVSLGSGVNLLTLDAGMYLPALVADKSVSQSTVQAGQIITYTITLTNTGTVLLTPVVVTDTLDDGLTFVSADLVETFVDGQVVFWADVTGGSGLPSGETVQITLLAVASTGDYDNVVVATGAHASGTVSNTDQVPVTVEGLPSISTFTLSANPDQLYANGLDEATLTVTATNEYGWGDWFAGRVITFSANLGDLYPMTAALDANGRASITYTAGLVPGTATVTATVADPEGGKIATADLYLQANPLNGKLISTFSSELITYTFVVSNAFEGLQQGVVLTGTVPDSTIFITATGGLSVARGGRIYVVSPATDLAYGQRYTLTWTVRVPMFTLGEIVTRAWAASLTARLGITSIDSIYRIALPTMYKNVEF